MKTISEVAKLLNISESTIRYYELEKIIKVPRGSNGRRTFQQTDIDWLKFIQHLKGTGMTINELKKYVEWRAEGDATIDNRLELLERTKEKLEFKMQETQKHLEILNDKINWYKDNHKNESFAEYLEKVGHKE